MIRLYPVNDSIDLAERLAEVPAGTHAAMEKAEQQAKAIGLQGYEAWSCATSTVDHLKLARFLAFGWGLFPSAVRSYFNLLDYGDERNPVAALAILSEMKIALPAGVCMNDVGGVKWC